MSGYTIVELMVTISIVAILAGTVGMFVVRLLTLHEQEREEAYLRERLADICGAYADYLSVGSSISNFMGNSGFTVSYRSETGGISLETGFVARVSKVTSFRKQNQFNSKNRVGSYSSLDLNVSARDAMGLPSILRREWCGDDVPLTTAHELKIDDNPVNLSYLIAPLNDAADEAALWRLQVRADYAVKLDKGELAFTNAIAERVVRLWNRE